MTAWRMSIVLACLVSGHCLADEPQPLKILDDLNGRTLPVLSIAFSRDGKALASGSWNGEVTVWNFPAMKDRITLRGHTEAISCMAFSPDGTVLASGTTRYFNRSAAHAVEVKLWNLTTGKELAAWPAGGPHGVSVNGLAFSPDRKSLVSSGGDGTVRRWDVETGKELATLVKMTTSPQCVAFSPDGKLLAWGGTAWGGYDCPVRSRAIIN